MQEDSLFTIKESSFKTSYSLISPDKLKGTVIRDAQTNLKGQSYEIHRDLTKYRWPEAPIVIQKSYSFLNCFPSNSYHFPLFCETVPLKKISF